MVVDEWLWVWLCGYMLNTCGAYGVACARTLEWLTYGLVLWQITGDRSRVGMTSDGVHYTDIEYGVATQLALNSLSGECLSALWVPPSTRHRGS